MRIAFAQRLERAAIDALALGHGWSLVQLVAAREGRPRQVVFAADDGSLIAFVDEHDASHAVIESHDPESIAQALGALGEIEADSAR